MDDNSYSETHANSETAPDAPPGALVVAATNDPGSTDANKFTGCYFEIGGTYPNLTYTLKNKGGVVLSSGTEGVTSLTFDHDQKKSNPGQKIPWALSNCNWIMNTSHQVTQITGTWNADDDEPTAGAQGGSFTATSSGGIDAVSASASA